MRREKKNFLVSANSKETNRNEVQLPQERIGIKKNERKKKEVYRVCIATMKIQR